MIDLSDFIRKGKYKKKYACTCDICGKSRGYRYKEDANNPCYSCAISIRNQKFKPDPSSDFVVSGDGDKKFKVNCFKCGKDRGYIAKQFVHKSCLSCAKKEFFATKKVDETKIVQRKLRHNVKSNINKRLKNRGFSKSGLSTFKVLPYSVNDLEKHLESHFKDGMSWDNYGKWEIDHIVPDSWFNYTSVTDEGFLKSWSLENLQPMWKKENLLKSNKYSGTYNSEYINKKK